MNQRKNSLLCPNCRRLISRDEENCPYCHISHPGSWLKNNPLTLLFQGQDNLVPGIIAVNVVMFIITLLFKPGGAGFSMNPMEFLSPDSRSLMIFGATGTVPVFGYGRWWSVISANYLHGSLMHIIFNMLVLRQLGPLVIREFGTNRMLTIYTLGGTLGFLVSCLAGVRFTIGASAAVCALMGALIYYGKSRGGVYGETIYSQIKGWAIGLAIFGFIVPGINNWGHAGGLAAGILLGYLLGYQDKGREKILHKYLAWISVAATGLSLLAGLFSGIFFLFTSH